MDVFTLAHLCPGTKERREQYTLIPLSLFQPLLLWSPITSHPLGLNMFLFFFFSFLFSGSRIHCLCTWPLSRVTADFPKWGLRYLPLRLPIHTKGHWLPGRLTAHVDNPSGTLISWSGHITNVRDISLLLYLRQTQSCTLDSRANFGTDASLKCGYEDTFTAGLR